MTGIINNRSKHTDANLPLFFILGRPRSGTTLLSMMLDAHPNIILPSECSLIINLYPKYHKITQWNERNLLELFSDIISHRKFELWRTDLDTLKKDILAFKGRSSFQTIIKKIYLHYQSFYEKGQIKLIGDKNPIYSIYPERLRKLFPDARFIHLVRDYRDQIVSMQRVDFEAPVVALQAWRWKFSTKRLFRLGKQHPSQYIRLKYESLVKNPEKELKRICGFLNVEFSKTMTDFHSANKKIIDAFGEENVRKYHQSLLKPVDSNKIEQWMHLMRPKDIKKADLIVGRYAALADYERMFRKFHMVDYFRIIPAVIYGNLSFRMRFLTDHLPHRMKLYIRNKGPLLAYMFNQLFGKKRIVSN